MAPHYAQHDYQLKTLEAGTVVHLPRGLYSVTLAKDAKALCCTRCGRWKSNMGFRKCRGKD